MHASTALPGRFSAFTPKSGRTNQQPLRDELLSVERLEERARALAGRFTVEPGKGRRGRSLFPRFNENTRHLREAYRVLSRDVHQGRYITPAAEWLLDNYHLVATEARRVRENLPRAYYRELPKLVVRDFVGTARVYALAEDVVRHSDSRLTVVPLTRFLDSFQMVAPLTLGELWAWPSMLIMALMENLRRLADETLAARAARAAADAYVARIDALGKGEVPALPPLLHMAQVVHLLQRIQGVGDTLKQAAGTQPVPGILEKSHPDTADERAKERVRQSKMQNKATEKMEKASEKTVKEQAELNERIAAVEGKASVQKVQLDHQAAAAERKAGQKVESFSRANGVADERARNGMTETQKDLALSREHTAQGYARVDQVASEKIASATQNADEAIAKNHRDLDQSIQERDAAHQRWLQAEPAARYGYAVRTRAGGAQTWDRQTEDGLQAEWDSLNMGSTWEASKENVRRGWEYGGSTPGDNHDEVTQPEVTLPRIVTRPM